MNLNQNLTGKNALITGSSSGIGLGIAKFLSKSGCRVTINGRNPEKLEAVNLSFPTKLNAVSADVSVPEEATYLVEKVVKDVGPLDILIANVGSGKSVQAGKESLEEWQRVFATNLWSTTNVVEASMNNFNDVGGSIVCVSSICGVKVIPGAPVTYSVSKAALNAYVKGISGCLFKKKIRINAIAPGNIYFSGSVWEGKIKQNKSEVNSFLKANVPMNRFGTIDEIVNSISYLASDLSSFCTGTVLIVDGGQSI